MPTSRFTSKTSRSDENRVGYFVKYYSCLKRYVRYARQYNFYGTMYWKKREKKKKKVRSRKTNFHRSNILLDLFDVTMKFDKHHKKWNKSVSSWKSTSRRAGKMSLNSGVYPDTAWMTSLALCIMMTEFELNTLLSQFLWSWSNVASDCKVEGKKMFQLRLHLQSLNPQTNKHIK